MCVKLKPRSIHMSRGFCVKGLYNLCNATTNIYCVMDAPEVTTLPPFVCVTKFVCVYNRVTWNTSPSSGFGGFDKLKPFSAIKKDFDVKGDLKLDSDNYIEVCTYCLCCLITLLSSLVMHYFTLSCQYDEMALSALLSMCAPSVFINDGARDNRARVEKDTSSYEKYGIVLGQVGARFEREGQMEARHMVVTRTQNTTANGYGPPKVLPPTPPSIGSSIAHQGNASSTATACADASAAATPAESVSSKEAVLAAQSLSASASPSSASSPATPSETTKARPCRAHELLRLWSRFYGLRDSGFPLFKVVHEAMQKASPTDEIRNRYAPIANPMQYGYLDLLVYRRRIAVVAETFLRVANTWGANMTAAAGHPVFAYGHVVGVGLGVWKVSERQTVCMLEVYRDLLCGYGADEWFGAGDWPHIRELDFSYFQLDPQTFWDVWKSVAVVKARTSKTSGSGTVDPVFEFLLAASKADAKQNETGCQLSILVKSKTGRRFRVMMSRRNPAQRLRDDYLESFFPAGMLSV